MVQRNPSLFLVPACAAVILTATGLVSAAGRPAATPSELEKAISAAQPGDEIVLADGTWRDVDILLDVAGTEDRPITLRAATPGKVVITGKSRLRIGGSFLVVQGLRFEGAWHEDDLIAFRRDSTQLARHCRLTDCTVIDCNGPDPSQTTRWVSLYGDHHRRVPLPCRQCS